MSGRSSYAYTLGEIQIAAHLCSDVEALRMVNQLILFVDRERKKQADFEIKKLVEVIRQPKSVPKQKLREVSRKMDAEFYEQCKLVEDL